VEAERPVGDPKAKKMVVRGRGGREGHKALIKKKKKCAGKCGTDKKDSKQDSSRQKKTTTSEFEDCLIGRFHSGGA